MPGERQRYVNRDTRFHPQPCAASAESTAATAVGAPPGGRSGSPEIQRSPWGFRPAPASSRDCIAGGGAPKQSAAAAAPAVGQAIKPWGVQKRGQSAGSTAKPTATWAPMTQRACLRQASVPAGHRKHTPVPWQLQRQHASCAWLRNLAVVRQMRIWAAQRLQPAPQTRPWTGGPRPRIDSMSGTPHPPQCTRSMNSKSRRSSLEVTSASVRYYEKQPHWNGVIGTGLLACFGTLL